MMGSENHVRSKLMEDENAVRAKKKKKSKQKQWTFERMETEGYK